MTGSVKWFSKEKGFGFICCTETNGEVFVHATDVQNEGNILIDGQNVTFEIENGPKGPKAKKVIVTPRIKS